ncbi:hypothetical protein BH11PSE2_BH11PSE2_18410 [soil metagenome]
MAMVRRHDDAGLWAGVAIGVVALAVLIFSLAVLLLGARSADDQLTIRMRPPAMPLGPKLPDAPKLPRGVS